MAKTNVKNKDSQDKLEVCAENSSVENLPATEAVVTTKPKHKLNKFQIINIVLVSCLTVIVLATTIYFIVGNRNKPLEEVLTPANYEQIEVGMTYDDVFDILGSGKRMASTGSNQVTYVWQSNKGKMIIVVFSITKDNSGIKPDKVVDKAESNVYS